MNRIYIGLAVNDFGMANHLESNRTISIPDADTLDDSNIEMLHMILAKLIKEINAKQKEKAKTAGI